MWFEAILGLKVNLDKTEIILVGRIDNLEELVVELGCQIGSLPSYLGLTLGVPCKSTGVWEAVDERVQKRLALWKIQYLSKGGDLLSLKHFI